MEPTSHNAQAAQPRATEAELLDHQVEQAKAAVLRTLDDVKANLGSAADVRLWTQRYPWLAVGVAAATGFAAASLVTPQRGQSVQDKIDELAAARSEQDRAPAAQQNAEKAAATASARTAITTTIFGSLFEILRIVLSNFATNVMRSPVAPSAEHNGQGPAFAESTSQNPSSTDDAYSI